MFSPDICNLSCQGGLISMILCLQKDCYEIYALVPGLLREEVSMHFNEFALLNFSMCLNFELYALGRNGEDVPKMFRFLVQWY